LIGDKVVIVNIDNIMLTGRKKLYKIYRHHTIYAGGLHEIPFKMMQEKKPEEIFKRTIKGMVNKTKH